MTRQELFDRIEAIVNEAGSDGETAPAVAVLCSLLGAMCDDKDVPLMHYVTDFSRDMLRGLSARGN